MTNYYDNIKGKDFMNYTVYEDGTIITPNGKVVKPTIRSGDNNRPIVRLRDKTGKYKQYPLSRVVYKAFNQDFDITNKDICIATKDGDCRNCSIDNLFIEPMREARGKGKRVIPNEDAIKIKKLIEKNLLSFTDVGELYGVAPSAVFNYCKKNDIKKPNLYW